MKRQQGGVWAWLAAIAAVCLMGLGGCGPLTFVVGIAPGQQDITATVVEPAERWTTHRVAIIDVSGMIINQRRPSLLDEGENPVAYLHEQLQAAAADQRVRAVILRINSPGGTVTASDAMYRLVHRFRKQTDKPVVALMMDVAASGGYYVACSADHIVAYPTAITGSIGVLIQTLSVKPALARIGVQTEAFVSGHNKDAGSPLSVLTDEHRQVLIGLVDDFYGNFTDVVRTSRPAIPAEQFDQVTDGRVFTGVQAQDAGLVDQVGDLHDAFARAKHLAGIEQANLVIYHRPLTHVGSPFASTQTRVPGSGPTQVNIAAVNLPDNLPHALSGAQFYYLWRPDLP